MPLKEHWYHSYATLYLACVLLSSSSRCMRRGLPHIVLVLVSIVINDDFAQCYMTDAAISSALGT